MNTEENREHTKKILQSLVKLKAYEHDIELQIEELEEDNKAPLSGISYDEKGGQTYKISSQTENSALEHIDRSRQLKYKLVKIRITAKRIVNSLEAVPALERNIVKLKTIDDNTWEKVMEELDFKSEKQLRERLNHALYIIGTLINDIDIDKILRYAAER